MARCSEIGGIAVGLDPAVVALLAAGIPASVAAGTFAASHIISGVSARRRRRLDAIALVLDALEAVPGRLRQPWIVRRWQSPELPIAYAVMRLVLVLARRDRILWEWLAVRTQELSDSSPVEQVRRSAEMTGMLIAFIRAPRRVRTLLRDSEGRGVWKRIE